MYNAMYGPGKKSLATRPSELSTDRTRQPTGNCYDMILMCRKTLRNDVCSAADNFCYAEVEYLFDIATGRDEYDVRYLVPDPFPYNYYPDYLNSPKVQQAIGAYVNFSDSNSAVGGAFGNTGDDARLQGAIGDSRKLIEGGTYTVQFSGDADYICEQSIFELLWSRESLTIHYSNRQLDRQRSSHRENQSTGVVKRRLLEYQHFGRHSPRPGQTERQLCLRTNLRRRPRSTFLSTTSRS